LHQPIIIKILISYTELSSTKEKIVDAQYGTVYNVVVSSQLLPEKHVSPGHDPLQAQTNQPTQLNHGLMRPPINPPVTSVEAQRLAVQPSHNPQHHKETMTDS
jgi:hypothetical protein